MHISDGILDNKISLAAFALSGVLAAGIMSRTRKDDISKISVMSAVFFVSSLIHIRIGASSIHLTMTGLTGILLGPAGILAILTGLLFQALIFAHGGITALGANVLIFSLPSLLVWLLFSFIRKRSSSRLTLSLSAGILTSLAVFLGAFIVLVMLYFSGREFLGLAWVFSISHGVLGIIEGVVSAMVIYQIIRIKPEMIIS